MSSCTGKVTVSEERKGHVGEMFQLPIFSWLNIPIYFQSQLYGGGVSVDGESDPETGVPGFKSGHRHFLAV